MEADTKAALLLIAMSSKCVTKKNQKQPKETYAQTRK